MQRWILIVTALATTALTAQANPIAGRTIDAIVDEGLNRSEVMISASQLMDGIGPRLTNSENFDRAADWAIARYTALGLKNVHREPYQFGLGWNLVSHSAWMIEPRRVEMTSMPIAWSLPTGGTIRAPIIVAPMSKPEHFAAWKGKLAGKIVLTSLPGTSSESKDPVFVRFDDGEIGKLNHYELPNFDPDSLARNVKSFGFAKLLSDFLKSEGAVAMAKINRRDGKLVQGEGYNYRPGSQLALPAFEIAAEDYRRLVRLAVSGPAPVIELAMEARTNTQDLTADNIIADIPGSDPKAGYVMAGAHFDSWIAADGASDNGAGSIVVMEAARILSVLAVKPKRTIRFALWSGEEQGLLGSRAYIEQHLATRPIDPELSGLEAYLAWPYAFPIQTRPGYGDLKAYFNMDNGSGKIRGIYAENNLAAEPTLKKWLAPFASMGAGSVVMSKEGATDHAYMQAIGIPAYQFIQDPLDYKTRVHHTNLDTVDHMRGDDLRQAATIMAAMLLQAANSDVDLPRPPLPTQPVKTDPFKIADPNN